MINPRIAPHSAFIALFILTGLIAYFSWDRTGFFPRSSTYRARTELRGSHAGPTADAIAEAYAHAGPLPELPDQIADGQVYTRVPGHAVCTFVSDDREYLLPEELYLDDPSTLRLTNPHESAEEGRTLAFYLNMLWTLRHGQRLTRLTASIFPGRHNNWAKNANMGKMAQDKTCKWLVYMDTDVYVRQQQYSFHDMRLRWGIHDGILLAATLDAYRQSGMFNSGFLIMQNTPELQGILQDWLDCPDKQPDCAVYAYDFMVDQGAFNAFVAPKLLERGVMASIPCNEATGHTEHAMHPQVQPLDPTDTGDICEGSIVTHSWWTGKPHLMMEATQMLAYNTLMALANATNQEWL